MTDHTHDDETTRYCPSCEHRFSIYGFEDDDASPEQIREHGETAIAWEFKARENVFEWGFQDPETVLLAMMEELGELTQAVLEEQHEDGDFDRIKHEIDDLGALMYQVEWALEDRYAPSGADQTGGDADD